MIDPFKYADAYESEWDLYLHEFAKSEEDVKNCFRQKLITKEELREGLEFFRGGRKGLGAKQQAIPPINKEKERKEKDDTERSNNKG